MLMVIINFAGVQSYFQLRELAFILEGDVHLRYRSFEDCADFERELCRASPYKLDIGAVYNQKVWFDMFLKNFQRS